VSRKDEYVGKMKKQLDDWNKDIDALQAKANQAKADLKATYEKQIAELHKARQEAERKLSEIKSAAEDSWENLKGETERTINALKAGVGKFKSQMK